MAYRHCLLLPLQWSRMRLLVSVGKSSRAGLPPLVGVREGELPPRGDCC